MKYIVRSIKYFLNFICIFAVIILLLVVTGASDGNIESLFRGGYDALWKIAAILAAVAAVYPKFGFVTRDIATERKDIWKTVTEYMEARGYIIERNEPGIMTFRHKSTASRLSRMFEDRVTFTSAPDSIRAEGLRKDVDRIASGIRNRLIDSMSNQ